MAQWRLKEIAAPQRWSQRALARATGLALGTVNAIWNNEAKRADLDTLAALARVLGVEPGELIVRIPDPAQEPSAQEKEG